MTEGHHWIRLIHPEDGAGDWEIALFIQHPDDGPLWWIYEQRRYLSAEQKIGSIEVGPAINPPADAYPQPPLPGIEWKIDGENNGEPIWRCTYGDYEARVNIGYEPEKLWSAVVNKSGKMNFASSADAKAWAEEQISARLKKRKAEAVETLRLYGEVEPLGGGDDWELEQEAFAAANTTDMPPEFYQDMIRKLWRAYCALETAPVPRLSITPAVHDAAVQAYDAFLRDVDVNSPIGALGAAVSAALHAKARARLPVHDEVEAYPLDAFIYKRDSTDEWILQLSGSINDTGFTIRHAESGDLPPEEALGLPTLYGLQTSVEELAEIIDAPEDMPDVIYFPADNVTSNEVYGKSAKAVRVMLEALAASQPRPVRMEELEKESASIILPAPTGMAGRQLRRTLDAEKVLAQLATACAPLADSSDAAPYADILAVLWNNEEVIDRVCLRHPVDGVAEA